MSGIKKKFSFQLLYAFSQLVFPLITYPYITRTIGAAGLGLLGYVEYVSGFIIAVASFGIPFYGVREVARLQNDPLHRQLLFRQLFFIHVIVSVTGVLVFTAIIKLSNQSIPLALVALGCAGILLPPFAAEWYMQGVEAFQYTTVRNIVLRALGVLTTLLLVSSQADYIVYYSIILLVQVAVAVTNLYKIGFPTTGFGFSGWKRHVKPLWRFFLTASIISMYVFFDVIVLGFFTTDRAVGYYTIAIKIVKLSLLLVLSLNVILFPRISFLTTTKDLGGIRVLLHKAICFIILLTLPIAAGFYFLAPQIIFLLAGQDFTPSILLVQILSGIPFIIGISNLFVYQILLPFGNEKRMLTAVFITCIVSLALHVVLAQLYKEKGTAIATVLTETVMAALTFYFSFKIFPFSFPLKILVQSSAALLPFIAFVFIAQRLMSLSLPIICYSVFPGILVYALLQIFLFKNNLFLEVSLSLRQRRKISVSNG
jgi:O-antigen/teichoic acid export membrane protein